MEDTLKKKLAILDQRNRDTFSVRKIANGFTVKTTELHAFKTLEEVIGHMRKHYS